MTTPLLTDLFSNLPLTVLWLWYPPRIPPRNLAYCSPFHHKAFPSIHPIFRKDKSLWFRGGFFVCFFALGFSEWKDCDHVPGSLHF